MFDDNDTFDGPDFLEKNEGRSRKQRKPRPETGKGDGDRFSKKQNKRPYDKSQRRQRFDY